MLSVSSINFNSKSNSIASNQPNHQVKMHSQPMSDTVSFSGGRGLPINRTEAQLKAISKLFGVPVEKIEQRILGETFETVDSFSLPEAEQMCKKAKKSLEKEFNRLLKFNDENQLPKFIEDARDLKLKSEKNYYDYGKYQSSATIYPAVRAGGYTPSKIKTPLVLSTSVSDADNSVRYAFNDMNGTMRKAISKEIEKQGKDNILEFVHNGSKYNVELFEKTNHVDFPGYRPTTNLLSAKGYMQITKVPNSK